MSNLKRGYLTREEENFYMVSKTYMQMLQGLRNLSNTATDPIWEEFEKRGMITPSMKKSIKMANTYLGKFIDELELNLDATTRSKLLKKLNKFDFKIVDEYTTQRLLRDVKDNLNYTIMDRNKFLDVLEEVTGVHCVGCKKDYQGCDLYKALHDVGIAHVGENINCPFSVDLSEFTAEEKERYEKLKKRIKTDNIFIKKLKGDK